MVPAGSEEYSRAHIAAAAADAVGFAGQVLVDIVVGIDVVVVVVVPVGDKLVVEVVHRTEVDCYERRSARSTCPTLPPPPPPASHDVPDLQISEQV